jgi:hypothetical protein
MQFTDHTLFVSRELTITFPTEIYGEGMVDLAGNKLTRVFMASNVGNFQDESLLLICSLQCLHLLQEFFIPSGIFGLWQGRAEFTVPLYISMNFPALRFQRMAET